MEPQKKLILTENHRNFALLVKENEKINFNFNEPFFWLFTRSAYRLSRLEGCTMMLAYLLYLAWRLSDSLSIFRDFS